jgi:hypothetical protein
MKVVPDWFVCLMVFNVTFNNFSVISWRVSDCIVSLISNYRVRVIDVRHDRVPAENHRSVASTIKLKQCSSVLY